MRQPAGEVVVAQGCDRGTQTDSTHVGCVGVARDQMREATVEERTRASLDRLPEAAIERRSRQLLQCPARYEWFERLGPLLDVGIPRRMRMYGREPSQQDA